MESSDYFNTHLLLSLMVKLFLKIGQHVAKLMARVGFPLTHGAQFIL